MSEYLNWTEEYLRQADSLGSYDAMRELALQILGGLLPPVAQVCGPLTTGGRGSLEANLEMFDEGLQLLATQGKSIFDQRPFEIPMQRLKVARKDPGYAYELLEEFYLPLFQSGLIQELHFLPGWETSIGARWEHEKAKALGITVFYFPQTLLG